MNHTYKLIHAKYLTASNNTGVQAKVHHFNKLWV